MCHSCISMVLCVAFIAQNRSIRSNTTFQRSQSSPRATVASVNDRTPSFVGVYRNASLRETASRSSASWLSMRQTSSATSSPSSARRRDVTVRASVCVGDRISCLATAPVPVTRTSSLSACRTSASTALKSAASVGRSASLSAGRVSMLPTAAHSSVKSANRDNSAPKTTGVQERLKVSQRCNHQVFSLKCPNTPCLKKLFPIQSTRTKNFKLRQQVQTTFTTIQCFKKLLPVQSSII